MITSRRDFLAANPWIECMIAPFYFRIFTHHKSPKFRASLCPKHRSRSYPLQVCFPPLAAGQCRPPQVTSVGIGPDYLEMPVIAEPKKRLRVFEYRGQPSFSVFTDGRLELVHQRGISAMEKAREAGVGRNTGSANSPSNVGGRNPYRDASGFRHDRYAVLVQFEANLSRSLGQIVGVNSSRSAIISRSIQRATSERNGSSSNPCPLDRT